MSFSILNKQKGENFQFLSIIAANSNSMNRVEIFKINSTTTSQLNDLSNTFFNSNSRFFYLSSNNLGVYYYWPVLFLSIFVIIGFIGNLFVCLAIKTDPKLQNATNYYLFSLATTDLLVSVLVIPLAILKNFYGNFIINDFL